MKNLLSFVCLVLLLTLAFSCSKPCGCLQPLPPPPVSGDVIAAGTMMQSDFIKTAAAFWYNNRLMRLSYSSNPSAANGVALSGDDVYIVGDTTDASKKTTAVYWKNGLLKTLAPTGSDATAIATSGSDVYIAGMTTNSNGVETAVYWKNGTLNTLTADPLKPSRADGIFVSGSDVYVCGYTTINGLTAATYWKNNVPVILPGGTKSSRAFAITFANGQVHVGGSTSNSQNENFATYWKNGIAAFTESQISLIYAIAVTGNDTHAVGASGLSYAASGGHASGPSYWKNGVFTPFGTVNMSFSSAQSIALSGSDVLIGGDNFSLPTLWKNGSENTFKEGRKINSIYIVP